MPKSDSSQSQWHVLDFLCDDEGSSALTGFTSGVRFHIIADADKFSSETDVGARYYDLTQKFHAAQPANNDSQQNSKTEDVNSDSGVDVSEERKASSDVEERVSDPEEAIHQWMVAPLLKTFDDWASAEDSSTQRTLQEWYNSPTHFYNLEMSKGGKEIEAVELEATSDLQDRMVKLLPQATLPKYITDELDTPSYSASDLIVLEASDEPPGTPYHPCRIQHRESKQTHFLKVVDNHQPQATKREIDILRRVKERQLDQEFNVPSLNGLVTFDNVSRTVAGKLKIMGFLLTEISEPTPLTQMLRSDVSQKKREAWAKEVQKVKELLHENDIVWGDAKADNFMVDSDGALWIIDFGGGYTEGWVDPQFNETVEGDDLGTEKIVNALKDPDTNVRYVEDEDEDSERDHVESQNSEPQKRKRKSNALEEDDSTDGGRASKISRGK